MIDRYAVIGNPVSHSKSPLIHAAFAEQTGQKLRYDKFEAPIGGFADFAAEFFMMGGAGCNVTVPFKEEACAFANRLSERAQLAGAANTLLLEDDGVFADNTDGVGLIRDLKRHIDLRGRRIVLLGAGGAARGAMAALLAEAPHSLTIANRSVDKARALVDQFAPGSIIAMRAAAYEALEDVADLVINATSASLAGEALPLPGALWHTDTVAYDMMYGKDETPFLAQARTQGADLRLDGLGMLVEQAAEAFFIWRGVRPQTQPILDLLRASL
jgi:shikimate dehydrogenase